MKDLVEHCMNLFLLTEYYLTKSTEFNEHIDQIMYKIIIDLYLIQNVFN